MKQVRIIQGGMGVGISNWRLANSVSRLGELGVVSGTGINNLFIRRLQDGDPGGHVRRALEFFPDSNSALHVMEKYFIPGGKEKDLPYKRSPMYQIDSPPLLQKLTVIASFVEVHLAKEGHCGVVGINLLEKIQLPNLACLYGAMLAGVDAVLMGAGIPKEIPGALDKLALHLPTRLTVDVAGSDSKQAYYTCLDPRALFPGIESLHLKRPDFYAVVASDSLAVHLAKKSNGFVNGFVVEYPCAGGHNAPPRGPLQLSSTGEPIYSERDEVNLERIRTLNRPFWLAGGYSTADQLAHAIGLGAAGVQIGTAFAFAEESGMNPELKQAILERLRRGEVPDIYTDPYASPSGFPFKVLDHEGTLSDPALYLERPRKCDLGYLRQAFLQKNGRIGYRCPSEPVDRYLEKGGHLDETQGRKCLCNGLMATAGFEQVQESGYLERSLVTSGEDLRTLCRYFSNDVVSYSARDVIDSLYLRHRFAKHSVEHVHGVDAEL